MQRQCNACCQTELGSSYLLWYPPLNIYKYSSPAILKIRGGAINFFSGRGVGPGFPKCGACKLIFASEKGGLWAENVQIFSKGGSCELTLLLEMGPLRATGEVWKGGLQGRTSPYPLSRLVPPPPPLVKTCHALSFWWVTCFFGRQKLTIFDHFVQFSPFLTISDCFGQALFQ